MKLKKDVKKEPETKYMGMIRAEINFDKLEPRTKFAVIIMEDDEGNSYRCPMDEELLEHFRGILGEVSAQMALLG